MKLGTSVRFLFPTSPATHERFRSLLASMPKGAFIERPMGAYAPDEQARNLMEVAAAARAAGLDGLLTGDSHGANPGYAATFSPLPTVARLMSVTGDMPIGVVLLAPFYHPVLLAEQLGTLAAFAGGPLIVTFVLGGRPPQFAAFGMEEKSRVGRLEEVVPITRALLAGERVTHRGRHFTLEGATISPLPRVPVEIWLGGTVPASAERAGRLGDAWLTGQNATDADLLRQLELYREAAGRAGPAPGGQRGHRGRGPAPVPRDGLRLRDGAARGRRPPAHAGLVRAYRPRRDARDPRALASRGYARCSASGLGAPGARSVRQSVSLGTTASPGCSV
jgi:hypothetical protein